LADAHDSGSCVQYALAGSSPVSRTTEPLRNQGFRFFVRRGREKTTSRAGGIKEL